MTDDLPMTRWVATDLPMTRWVATLVRHPRGAAPMAARAER